MLTDGEIANIVTICGQEPNYEICKNHNLRVSNLDKNDKVVEKEIKKFLVQNDVVIQCDNDVVVFYR